MEKVLDSVIDLIPISLAIIGISTVFYGVHRFMESRRLTSEGYRFGKQMLFFVLSLASALLIIITLPIDSELRGQLLSFLGILLSAAIALSSTTLLGNALASLMIKVIKGFRMGDFIRVGDHFGRVSERGLFHTEIQTEERELTTFPNLYLITNPVTTIRSSGTIISTTVSLGYDAPRSKVEPLLLEAAEKTGLEDPFVQVLQLGDFSVTYRIAGLLKEISKLISTRSQLRAATMDALHRGEIEIVSPNFMNQRVYPDSQRFIPRHVFSKREEESKTEPEKTIFDKAEQASRKEQLSRELEELELALKDAKEEEIQNIQTRIDQRIEELKTLEAQTSKAGKKPADGDIKNNKQK